METHSDTLEDTCRFEQNYGGPWPHILSAEIARIFRVRSLDTTYILNRHNVIIYNDSWPTGYEALEREVLKVLPTEGS